MPLRFRKRKGFPEDSMRAKTIVSTQPLTTHASTFPKVKRLFYFDPLWCPFLCERACFFFLCMWFCAVEAVAPSLPCCLCGRSSDPQRKRYKAQMHAHICIPTHTHMCSVKSQSLCLGHYKKIRPGRILQVGCTYLLDGSHHHNTGYGGDCAVGSA